MNIEQLIEISLKTLPFIFASGVIYAKFNSMLDKHDKAIEKILQRLDKMDDRFESIGSKFDLISSNLSFMQGWVMRSEK